MEASSFSPSLTSRISTSSTCALRLRFVSCIALASTEWSASPFRQASSFTLVLFLQEKQKTLLCRPPTHQTHQLSSSKPRAKAEADASQSESRVLFTGLSPLFLSSDSAAAPRCRKRAPCLALKDHPQLSGSKALNLTVSACTRDTTTLRLGRLPLPRQVTHCSLGGVGLVVTREVYFCSSIS